MIMWDLKVPDPNGPYPPATNQLWVHSGEGARPLLVYFHAFATSSHPLLAMQASLSNWRESASCVDRLIGLRRVACRLSGVEDARYGAAGEGGWQRAGDGEQDGGRAPEVALRRARVTDRLTA